MKVMSILIINQVEFYNEDGKRVRDFREGAESVEHLRSINCIA
jgi:hypothetical protein